MIYGLTILPQSSVSMGGRKNRSLKEKVLVESSFFFNTEHTQKHFPKSS